MKKPRRDAPPPTPAAGGSWLRDPLTGALTRAPEPVPAPPTAPSPAPQPTPEEDGA